MSYGAYEPGMKVHFDATARTVTVSFRGRVIALPGQYGTLEEGRWAGEAFCRENGWEREITKRPLRGRAVEYSRQAAR
jgi:hypothetical protein